MRYVNCWPKPIQKNPPIFIPGGGSLETYDFCLENDYNYSYLSFSWYLRAKQLMDGYWERVEKSGKDMSPYRGGFAQTIIVADSDEDAEKYYREHIDYFYNRCLHVYPGFADAPGYRTIKTLKAGVTSQMTRQAVGQVTNMSWDQLIKDGYIIAGSPTSVVAQMKNLIHSLRVGNIFCLIHVGNMPDEKTRHSTKLFAEQVMPHLQNEWPEYKDDNRFWINPLPVQATREGVAAVGGV